VALVACAGSSDLEGFETSTVEVGARTLTVAVAESADQRNQGLRRVEELPEGLDGMLFVFEEPRMATFGMRDTLMPLDIWWFAADGTLLGSTEMTPCPADPCTAYGSPGEVAHALETPAGEVEFAPRDVLAVESP
jgi:uncharacterized membrane protein (UPF0127 family)